MVGLFPVSPAGAGAGTTLKIKVGTGFGREFPGGSSRFYPDTVAVHQGDTLKFTFPPMLIPADTTPAEFLAENADLGDPYHVLATDPDDGATAVKINPPQLVPLDCGPVEAPCHYDATTGNVLNPGLLGEGKFFVVVDAAVGSVFHGLSSPWGQSSLRIEVVEDTAAADTQAQLDARAADLKAQDQAAAFALFDEYSNKHTFTEVEGHKVWDAWGGIDQGPIVILAMFPAKLKIAKGDSVMWHFDLTNEVHSATMPLKKANKLARGMFSPKCDPDGDDGPGPDNNPQINRPPFCNDPTQLEADMANVFQKGDGVQDSPNEYQDSGWRGPENSPDGFFTNDPFTVSFNTKTDRKGIGYACSFHGSFMKGYVVVK
jgi:plastocyanin